MEYPVSSSAACAHLRVSYRTEAVGIGGTRGWWECDSGCGTPFSPVPSPRDRHPTDDPVLDMQRRCADIVTSVGEVLHELAEATRRCAGCGHALSRHRDYVGGGTNRHGAHIVCTVDNCAWTECRDSVERRAAEGE